MRICVRTACSRIDARSITQADSADAFIAHAPYPFTKCAWENEKEAKLLMQVDKPIVFAAFEDDALCGLEKFPRW